MAVHELARDIGFSRRHFGERFMSEFGIAPKAAARVFRFEHACRLFLRSPRRIADVAVASGFHLVSWWILRKVPSAPMLHGALIGIVATAMYLGLVFAQPGGFAAAVGTYGVPLFWLSQAMRIAGCVAGAARNPRPAAPSVS